jgi:hypothetical protein
MLLRNRPVGIDQRPATTADGFEHVGPKSIAVVQWLLANRVEFVLVGPVARAIRGDMSASGPVAIVPAPYGRNLDRLSRALWSAHARRRVDVAVDEADGATGATGADTVPIKLTSEKLVGSLPWLLRCGVHDLDVEGRPAGVPRYQELLYEAARFDVAPGLSVEVAAPEDIEHYAHVRRTGSSPEMRVTRTVREPADS